jgi:hypothetical protein
MKLYGSMVFLALSWSANYRGQGVEESVEMVTCYLAKKDLL